MFTTTVNPLIPKLFSQSILTLHKSKLWNFLLRIYIQQVLPHSLNSQNLLRAVGHVIVIPHDNDLP
jgi:hypothetical protein